MTPEIEKLRARLQLLEGRARDRQRKDRTRRLIVLGAALEAAWSAGPPEAAAAGLVKLGQHIPAARDRALLGLPPLMAPAPDQEPQERPRE